MSSNTLIFWWLKIYIIKVIAIHAQIGAATSNPNKWWMPGQYANAGCGVMNIPQVEPANNQVTVEEVPATNENQPTIIININESSAATDDTTDGNQILMMDLITLLLSYQNTNSNAAPAPPPTMYPYPVPYPVPFNWDWDFPEPEDFDDSDDDEDSDNDDDGDKTSNKCEKNCRNSKFRSGSCRCFHCNHSNNCKSKGPRTCNSQVNSDKGKCNSKGDNPPNRASTKRNQKTCLKNKRKRKSNKK